MKEEYIQPRTKCALGACFVRSDQTVCPELGARQLRPDYYLKDWWGHSSLSLSGLN